MSPNPVEMITVSVIGENTIEKGVSIPVGMWPPRSFSPNNDPTSILEGPVSLSGRYELISEAV